MAYRPGLDILNYLDAHSTALTGGTNLFQGIGRMQSATAGMPVESVFVIGDGGRAPDRVLGLATQLNHPHVEIIIRSSGFTSGQNLAWVVQDTLQSATLSTDNAYMDIRVLQSQPNFLDQDRNNHYHWSVNVEALYQSTS